MTTDQFRAYLDAHCVPGPPTVVGWYAVDVFDGTFTRFGVAEFDDDGDIWWGGSTFGISDLRINRHAPLPDFGAMARELEELRARRPAICECVTASQSYEPVANPSCVWCQDSGAVWVTA